jgi:hypothetical protein
MGNSKDKPKTDFNWEAQVAIISNYGRPLL